MSSSPSYTQSALCTVLLVCLSLITLPFTLIAVLLSRVSALLHPYTVQRPGHRKTILLTGARNVKCLAFARAFGSAGHRVVVAEEPEWHALNPTRFSNTVSSYHILPSPADSVPAYAARLLAIARDESIDLFLPCSSPRFTVEDAQAALSISTQLSCESFIQHPNHAATLHWKHLFVELCNELSMSVPESRLVTSIEEAVAFVHSEKRIGKRFTTKFIVFDEVARIDNRLLPLDIPALTEDHLRTLPVAITHDTPYQVQQYIQGEEYCTHAAVRDGELLAFVCCPSSDMLMRYVVADKTICDQAEKWTRQFLSRWKDKLVKEGKSGIKLTGHYCLDFIREASSGTMYAIECNPRAHTANVLLSSCPDFAAHYLGESPKLSCLRPPVDVLPQSWLAYNVPISLATWLRLPATLHPALRGGATQGNTDVPIKMVVDFVRGREQDPTWSHMDPVPFLVLAHFQWPWMLLKRSFWEGKTWSRANVSTARIWG